MFQIVADAARKFWLASPTNGVPVGRTVTLSAQPDGDTAAYASGDLIGEKLILLGANGERAVRSPGAGGVIQSVSVVDLAKQSLALDVVFFLKEPLRTTFTDNAALDIDDADLMDGIRTVNVAATDYDAFADNSHATVPNVGIGFQLGKDLQDLYCCLVARGAIDMVVASDIRVFVDILQD